MNIVRHGLSVGIERVGGYFFMNLKIAGKLSHEDYEVMVPMLESAIEGIRHPQIDALVDLTELEGWEMRAAWDDLKLGLRHGDEFRNVAIIGEGPWMKFATRVGSWFLPGKARIFADKDAALEWLCDREQKAA